MQEDKKGCKEEFDDEISSKDYGFVVTEEGELKAVFMPADSFSMIPSSVKKVFKIFGIPNPETIDVHTVH